MKYEYESITNGVFRFTIPGTSKTVELFIGSKVIVEQQLAGSYLRLLKLVREIPEEAPAKKAPIKTTKPKAKVADKITAVTETEEVPAKVEKAEVETKDAILEVTEKPAPKKRGRQKKTS